MKLFIVESPGKTKKIAKILGGGWRVEASVGHIRDLPAHEIGVEPPDFRPKYIIIDGAEGRVGRLRKLAREADEIYLATDPDREGEAIAWHLYQALGLKGQKVVRVRFNAIGKKPILEAVAKPDKIDANLVAAQETRRVLDRLVGYLVSPRLGRGLSAGRVQSPGLRLVVERERAIRGFKPRDYYEVVADMDQPMPWRAMWDASAWIKEGESHFFDRETAEVVANTKRLMVTGFEKGKQKRKPPPPFITSTLQQVAAGRLKIPVAKVMELAQSLYQQGAITYHRTDNPNLSPEGIEAAMAELRRQNLSVADKPNRWRAKGDAQEAHEAIRPVDFQVEEAGENDLERALYQLIRQRALACQSQDAVYDTYRIDLEGDVAVPLGDRPKAKFVAKGRRLTQQTGWLAIYQDDDGEEDDPPVPVVAEGEVFDCQCHLLTKKTTPPPRYTEASLVKKLETLGIGRPSTYASIIANLKRREYMVTEKGKLVPTDKGERLIDTLMGHRFSFLDYGYTRDVEAQLDEVACGHKRYLEVIRALHGTLEDEMAGLPEVEERGPREMGQPTVFECKKCRQKVTEYRNRWQCGKCRAVVWKKIAGRAMSEDEAARLFGGERIELEGFVKKAGGNFAAPVKLKGGKPVFDFDKKKPQRRGRKKP